MGEEKFKSFKELPVPVGQSAKPIVPQQRIKIYEERGTGRVIDDPRLKIDWKPIDVVAARVVASAQWYNQPPPPPPKFQPEKTMPEKTDPISSPGVSRIKTKTKITEEGHRETLLDMHSADAAIIDHHETETKKKIKVAEELTERARELTATIQYLVTELQGPWAEFQDYIKSALGTVREQRIALGSETRLLLGSLKEVRQFFLEESYETEIRRLAEFIDLCERLQALKQDGFLDVIADTILKLDK